MTNMRSYAVLRALVAAVLLLTLQAGALYLMGQPPFCECGNISLWSGVVLSAENSQQISDWYTFSHVIHGIIFYFVLWLLFPRIGVLPRFAIALGLEVSWEIIENTPWLIEHYRQQALAQGYIGDSILNSISDTIAMILGFLLAARAPALASVGLVLALEVYVGAMIRDNLTLNILGFFAQPEFISNWQSGTVYAPD